MQKPDTSQEFTTIEWAEGDHSPSASKELQAAIRQDAGNIAYDLALKVAEKPMLDAGDPHAKRLKGKYTIKGYDPGSTLLRAIFGYLGVGKSQMITEVEYEYEGKRLATIEIKSYVQFNDILTTVEQQQAEWFWGEAQVYWGDWLGIGSGEVRKRKGLE